MLNARTRWLLLGNCLSKRFARFRSDDEGAMIIFALYMFVAMLLIGGMAVDVVRTEHMRVRLQNTLDRALLAAADIDQKLDPVAVVLDYMAKAGLAGYVDPASIVVDDDLQFSGPNQTGARSISYRSVSATAAATVPTLFLKAIGINSLAAPTSGAAEESVTQIEIVLVLDLSGSMVNNNSTRLADLKVAAKNFVSLVLGNQNAQDKIAISFVPYSGQVKVHPAILAQYTTSGTHPGNCIHFEAADFNTTTIAANATLNRAQFFDPWYSSQAFNLGYCPSTAGQEIFLPTNNITALRTRIDAFQANGNTSLDVGMKWGTAMLDPAFRPKMNALINGGLVQELFRGRPYDFDERNTKKYIIMMSDGENTDQFMIKPPYTTGMSPVFRNSSGQISVRHNLTAANVFYRYNNDNWSTTAYTGSTQMTWDQVWSMYTMYFVYKELYADPLPGTTTDWRNNMRTAVGPDTKDARTSTICSAARNAGIVTYTIGFQTPARGTAALQNCAFSQLHFLPASNGAALDAAFQAIARDITKLRLTQ